MVQQIPTATSTTSQPRWRRPASRESKNTRAGRLLYNINTRDQITGSEHGGPLHVSGTLDRPGKIASTGSTETPTALDGSFSAWFILLDNEPYDYIYTQKDHLGSNRNGYAYDAYGNLTDWDNEAPPWFERLYTGHLYDASAGLYLAPYRSYAPQLGRWLSREPLGLDGPNLYHYVFNDPVNGLDPTGLQTDINLVDPKDRIIRPDMAANPRIIPDTPGVITVLGHGSERGLVTGPFNRLVRPWDLATEIRAHKDYVPGIPVRIISCNVGNSAFPQQLANELGSVVLAPNGFYYMGDDHPFIKGAGIYKGPRIILPNNRPGRMLMFFPLEEERRPDGYVQTKKN